MENVRKGYEILDEKIPPGNVVCRRELFISVFYRQVRIATARAGFYRFYSNHIKSIKMAQNSCLHLK